MEAAFVTIKRGALSTLPHLRPVQRQTARSISHSIPPVQHTRHHITRDPGMTMAFTGLSMATTGALVYGCSGSGGRISHRYEDREQQLNRKKWLESGEGLDDTWVKA